MCIYFTIYKGTNSSKFHHEMKKAVDDIWKRCVRMNEGEDIITEMILKHLWSRRDKSEIYELVDRVNKSSPVIRIQITVAMYCNNQCMTNVLRS